MNIDKIKRRLLVKYPFFGSVVVNLNYIENKDCKTLGTDGINIYYNPEFINELTEDEQTFMFAHEVCHVAFDHINRRKDKDLQLWNIATDSVINAFLEKDGLPLVKGAIKIPDAINYNAEQLYKKLLEQKIFNLNLKNDLSLPDDKKSEKKTEDNKAIKRRSNKINNEEEQKKIRNKSKNIDNNSNKSMDEIEEYNDVIENDNNQKDEGSGNDANYNIESLKNIGNDIHDMWNKEVNNTNYNDKNNYNKQENVNKKEDNS